MESAKLLLEQIVRAIVDNPSAVSVETQTDEMGILLTLHVDKADMGKVIGREGNTAKAIRSLLRVVGAKEKAHINMKIAEPGGEVYSKPRSRPSSSDEFEL